MNTQITKETAVNRPTPEALTSSVLDHATVVENAKFGLRNNEGLWPSYNCMDTMVPTTVCPDVPDYKTFAFAEWVPAFEFAVYGGAQCLAVGLDQRDMDSEVRRVFGNNEGKAVEEALLYTRFVASDSGAQPGWDAPVDLTVGGPVPLVAALALLEGYAASVYAGVPTIHMPRAAAVLLGEKIVWSGGKAYTRSGAKVALGGGYDTPDSRDGTMDLYATGEVYVERSGEVNLSSFVIPGDGSGTGSDENGLQDNTVVTLTERMFRAGVDCFVAVATGVAWS